MLRKSASLRLPFSAALPSASFFIGHRVAGGCALITSNTTISTGGGGFFSSSSSSTTTITPLQFQDIRHHGYGKSERGHTRLSFEEKLARKSGKAREDRRDTEKRQLESENYIDVELPDICAADQEKILAKAEAQTRKLLHPAQALFEVEVEIHGQMKPLSQLATIVKVAGREYEIIPNNSAFTSPILLRLPRYDSALNAHKEGDKIRVTMPQMTRAKRVAVADFIKDLGTKCKVHYQGVRRNAINFINDLQLAEDVTRVRTGEAEEIVKNCEKDLVKKLEEMAQEVLMAGNDEEEGDGQTAV